MPQVSPLTLLLMAGYCKDNLVQLPLVYRDDRIGVVKRLSGDIMQRKILSLCKHSLAEDFALCGEYSHDDQILLFILLALLYLVVTSTPVWYLCLES